MSTVAVHPEINLDGNLCESEFTLHWVLESLMKKDEVFKNLHGSKILKRFEAKDISGGKGMFSTVLKIWLHMEDGKNNEELYTTILKIPGIESFAAITAEGKDVEDIKFGGNPLTQSVIQMHDTECHFYELIAPLISKYVPRVYNTKRWVRNVHKGCLHMEDLSIKGKNMDYFNTLTVPQFKNVINALAFFHSKILSLDQSQWRGKFISQRNIFSEKADATKELSCRFIEMVGTGKEELRKLFLNEKIQKIVFDRDFINYTFFESFQKIGLPILLVHSDLWASNIMFKTDSEGNFTDEITALLDWQCFHEGNWLLDFVRLMSCSLDGDVRREMEQSIFDFYIRKLTEYLGRDPGFNANQMKKAYNFVFLAHLDYVTIMPGAIFSARASTGKEFNDVEKARMDKCVLRAIHAHEDALSLLNSGEFDQWL